MAAFTNMRGAQESSSSHNLHLSSKKKEKEKEKEENQLTCKYPTGGWRVCTFLIWFEMIEKLTFYGIFSNLITYFTNELCEGTAESTKNVNIWIGVGTIFSILGAFVADSFLGQYCTIALMATVEFMPVEYDISIIPSCPDATEVQVGSFIISIYFICIGAGSLKPCLEAFAANQFDDTDPIQKQSRTSLFKWCFFSFIIGVLLAYTIVVYIQDTMGWGVSFGFLTLAFGTTLILFLAGTPFYRRNVLSGSPFISIAQVLVAAVCNRNIKLPYDSTLLYEKYDKESLESRKLLHTEDLRFLDKAATIIRSKKSELGITNEELNVFLTVDASANPWKLCSIHQVEEVKLILRIIPLWVSSIMYGIMAVQTTTLFIKQGNTVDRKITSNFNIPAPALNSSIPVLSLILLPLYNRAFVPAARWLTGNERGITLLQRMGVGLFLPIMVMLIAALTEMKRLQIVMENGLIDQLDVTIPMSILWFLPQYFMVGVSDVFMVAGLQEFFCDQMPDTMKSIGIALFYCTYGMGSFINSFLITIVDTITSKYGGQSWFVNNLNRCHLDYFYLLLAFLSTVTFCIYVMIARSFNYKRIR